MSFLALDSCQELLKPSFYNFKLRDLFESNTSASNCSPAVTRVKNRTRYKVFTSNLGIFSIHKELLLSRQVGGGGSGDFTPLYPDHEALASIMCYQFSCSSQPGHQYGWAGQGLMAASLHSTAPPLFSLIGWDTAA